jgi:hypothetical protein
MPKKGKDGRPPQTMAHTKTLENNNELLVLVV